MSKQYHLSVLAIFKNETMNLKIWLDHYLWQGVDHFFLIDNGSTDNPHHILQSYIDRGLVTYRSCPARYDQVGHYNRMFEEERMRDRTEWLCVCDLDEFFYGTHTTLYATLQTMGDNIDVVHSAWKMFGHENLVAHPPDIRTSIVHRNPDIEHQHTKYICRTRTLTHPGMLWIHYVRVPPHLCGGMQCIPLPGTVIHTENDRIQLNHYVLQSLQYYQEVKMTRGAADGMHHEYVRDMNYFHQRVTNCICMDDELARLVRDGYP